MTTEDIQLACLADLGRQRQEELPLSDRERKGPSFAPTRRNGTGHYPPSLKEGLESKWDVKIDDEEAEQMKGLAIEDARPWAKKIVQDFIKRNPVKSAPLAITQISRGNKRPKRGGYTLDTSSAACGAHTASAASLGGLVPPGGSVKHFNSSKPTNAPSSSTSSRPQEAITTSATIALPIRPPKPENSEYVVMEGICKLLHAKDRSVLFMVSYALQIQSNRACLVLSSEAKGEKIHDVLDLQAPENRDDCCRVCYEADGNTFVYMFQFPNADDACKFKTYLECLQQAATREDVTKSVVKQPAETAKLVDLDPPPRVPTIEDAAQKLVELMEIILPEALAAGLLLSDDTLADIEEAAIDNWLTRGFLKSETDDMQDEVLDLIRVLVRFKRKSGSRRQAKEPAIKSLKGFDENTKPSRMVYTPSDVKEIKRAVGPRPSTCSNATRITYTASEIESVARARGSTPVALDRNIVTPRRPPIINKCSPAAVVANVSKHKDWLSGKSDQVMTPTPPDSVEKASPSSGGLGTSR